jgi:hypothetical protein
MPASPPPLWDGYDDADEDQLVALLERKAAAAGDPDDDSVDPTVARDLATAVASHEWLKRKLDDSSYRARLHKVADDIRVGSWRPK